METMIVKAKAKLKAMTARIESTLKSIAYKADMAAKTVATLVKGVLNGQHKP